jgi:hypothetical protein
MLQTISGETDPGFSLKRQTLLKWVDIDQSSRDHSGTDVI